MDSNNSGPEKQAGPERDAKLSRRDVVVGFAATAGVAAASGAEAKQIFGGEKINDIALTQYINSFFENPPQELFAVIYRLSALKFLPTLVNLLRNEVWRELRQNSNRSPIRILGDKDVAKRAALVDMVLKNFYEVVEPLVRGDQILSLEIINMKSEVRALLNAIAERAAEYGALGR